MIIDVNKIDVNNIIVVAVMQKCDHAYYFIECVSAMRQQSDDLDYNFTSNESYLKVFRQSNTR